MAAGDFRGQTYGAGPLVESVVAAGNAAAFAMASLNTCWAARFTNITAKKPKSIKIAWSAISSPGVVEVRIETIDGSTRKPTGTLYDDNATVSAAPAGVGWQTFTFASLPSVAMSADTVYAIVVITTTGGTTQTLRSNINLQGSYGTIALHAADGTTRSNLAEQASTTPIFSIVWEDDTEEFPAGLPYDTTTTPTGCYGTRAWGAKIVVPTGVTLSVRGVNVRRLTKTGTPSDLRCRILNSSDGLVTNASRTSNATDITSVAGARAQFIFPELVTLTAGTYRVICDQDGASTSGNNYQTRHATAPSSDFCPANCMATATDDYTAGTISWSDSAAQTPAISFLLDDMTASGGEETVVVPVSQFQGAFF